MAQKLYNYLKPHPTSYSVILLNMNTSFYLNYIRIAKKYKKITECDEMREEVKHWNEKAEDGQRPSELYSRSGLTSAFQNTFRTECDGMRENSRKVQLSCPIKLNLVVRQ